MDAAIVFPRPSAPLSGRLSSARPYELRFERRDQPSLLWMQGLNSSLETGATLVDIIWRLTEAEA